VSKPLPLLGREAAAHPAGGSVYVLRHGEARRHPAGGAVGTVGGQGAGPHLGEQVGAVAGEMVEGVL
jgi:hypothetical protein